MYGVVLRIIACVLAALWPSGAINKVMTPRVQSCDTLPLSRPTNRQPGRVSLYGDRGARRRSACGLAEIPFPTHQDIRSCLAEQPVVSVAAIE